MEMVSAKAILYNNKNTESLLEIHPDEQPVSLQFFGSDPKIMSEMAKRVEERPFDIMDINMGCPVPNTSPAYAAGSFGHSLYATPHSR